MAGQDPARAAVALAMSRLPPQNPNLRRKGNIIGAIASSGETDCTRTSQSGEQISND